MAIETVGIIGAGKLGTALGALSGAAGLTTLVSSRPSPVLDLVLASVLPGAELVGMDDLAERADAIVLAVPATAAAGLAPALRDYEGLVIDPTNPWEATGTAEPAPRIGDLLPRLHSARSLNHFSYEELIGSARRDSPLETRRAVAVVTEDDEAAARGSELVDRLGFAPVRVPADRVSLFEPDGRLFGAWLTAAELRERIA